MTAVPMVTPTVVVVRGGVGRRGLRHPVRPVMIPIVMMVTVMVTIVVVARGLLVIGVAAVPIITASVGRGVWDRVPGSVGQFN